MSTQTTTIMVTAASLTPGDIVLFGTEETSIISIRPNHAYPELLCIGYKYKGDNFTYHGAYRADEMMEKIR